MVRQPEPSRKLHGCKYRKQTVQHLFPPNSAYQQPQRHSCQHQEMNGKQCITKQKGMAQFKQVIFHHSQRAAFHRRRSNG